MTQEKVQRTPPVRTAPFAWCGWSLALPAKWRPTRLEGDADKGSVLFADLDRPRLGLRWETPPEKRVLTRDEAEWLAGDLLRREVGRLAADEARDYPIHGGDWTAAKLYAEPKPPGRDVFVGVSRASRRVVELVYHTRRRDRLLGDVLLPTLADAAADAPRRWSIFDLDAATPAGYAMRSHTFSAGDLRLTLTRKAGRATWPLVIRQVRPARLALSRQPVERWLERFVAESLRFHKPRGAARPSDAGLAQTLVRRRRYGWLWTVPRRLEATVLHDEVGDRLLLVRGIDAETTAGVMASMSD